MIYDWNCQSIVTDYFAYGLLVALYFPYFFWRELLESRSLTMKNVEIDFVPLLPEQDCLNGHELEKGPEGNLSNDTRN